MRTASEIIEALNGSAVVSRETGFPLTTIESWKASNFIPEWRRDKLIKLAKRLDVALSRADFPTKDVRIPRSQRAAA